MATDQIKFTPLDAYFNNHKDGVTATIQVTKVSGGPQNFKAFAYRCRLIEDNDGAPTCYGWDNPGGQVSPPWPKGTNPQTGLTPLERAHGQAIGLANASSDANLWRAPFYWAGLFAATPAFARANGLRIDMRDGLASTLPEPAPSDGLTGKRPVVKDTGYYVSTTAQPANPGANLWDQGRYYNAATVPYAVWANQWAWANTGVGLGDVGLAINNSTGAASEFAYLDSGTNYQVGESSRNLCRTLVPTADDVIMVRDVDYISFLAFPGSQGGAGVGDQLDKLAAADNGDELILFFALGADYTRYKAWLRRFYRTEDYHSIGLPSGYHMIMMGFSHKGYPVDGIFHAPEQSVNAA
jgi:hypothetical protein